MEKERLQEFTTRVTQANRSELVVIMYEIMESDMRSARQAMANNNIMLFEKECRHAQRVLNELMATLDYHYVLAYDLLSLYSYMNKKLIAALIKRDEKPFLEVERIIEKLKAAYEQVSKQDVSGPMMKNTQQIYAGLTYGRGTLNESSIDANVRNRGFMA